MHKQLTEEYLRSHTLLFGVSNLVRLKSVSAADGRSPSAQPSPLGYIIDSRRSCLITMTRGITLTH